MEIRRLFRVGPSACSRIGHERWENISNLRLYEERLAADEPVEEKISLSPKEEMEEFAFLGLRMKEGINGREFYQRYGKEIMEVYGSVVKKLVKEKMIFLNNGNIQMTYKGAALGNYVFEQFLFGLNLLAGKYPYQFYFVNVFTFTVVALK